MEKSKKRLVSEDLEALFVDAIEITSDMYLRERFEKVGLQTSEARVRSPNPRVNGYMETLPVKTRIKHYFETVDWSDRNDIAKVLCVVNHSLRAIGTYHPSGIHDRAAKLLNHAGLKFDGQRIVRK